MSDDKSSLRRQVLIAADGHRAGTRLAQAGGVSRQVANAHLQALVRDGRVDLDCAGIAEIGQAFADEMFGVFAQAHPEICITPLNTTPAVAQMIQRAEAACVAQTQGGGGTPG